MLETASLDINASLLNAFADQPLNLSDLEAVRLILRGDSIIDWNRANFRSMAEVDRYLWLHQLNISEPEDLWRLQYVHGEAVNYLEEHLGLHFPADLQRPSDVRELFLEASHVGNGFRRRQILSCVLLKLMHVINHMEAAELRYQTPLSEADLMELAERRIMSAAEKMRASGFPLVAFYGSRKARNSIITKLIAKKENIAATIFDKLRFRLVTHDRDHILPAIAWLTRNLFPFNYIIPGQSHNNLMLFRDMLRVAPLDTLGAELTSNGIIEQELLTPEENPFSGGSYRMINFIADFPVRIDHLVDVRYGALLGRTVFVMVEFQVIDRQTARENEEGENAHRLYKERQRTIVDARLRKGGRRKERERRDESD